MWEISGEPISLAESTADGHGWQPSLGTASAEEQDFMQALSLSSSNDWPLRESKGPTHSPLEATLKVLSFRNSLWI